MTISPVIVIIMVLISFAIIIILDTKLNINLGVTAIVCGLIICTFVLGMRPRELYAEWPSNIMLQIIAITFFYGFVAETGALDFISRWLLYLTRKRTVFVPFVFFILAPVICFIGVNPVAVYALLLPIAASICSYTNMNPAYIFIGTMSASNLGQMNFLTMPGISATGLLANAVGDDVAAQTMPRVYLNFFLVTLIAFVIYFIVVRGWKFRIVEEHIAVINKKPDPATREQKIALVLMIIAVLAMVLPGLLHLSVAKYLDIGFVYLAVGVAGALFKLGNVSDIITNRIPWGIILLICGCSLLIVPISASGGIDMITGWIGSGLPHAAVLPVLTSVSNLTGVFADFLGAVIPLLTPISANLAGVVGISPAALVSAGLIGGIMSGAMPFSTGGATTLAFVPKKYQMQTARYLFIYAIAAIILSILLSMTGILGA